MSLFDGIKERLGLGGKVDEIVQAAQGEGEILVPANRDYRRAVARSQRLKGPGYTRAMRKGREQRVRTTSDTHTNHAADAAEGRSL